MRRPTVVATIALALLLVLPLSAQAHVGVRPAEAPAGATRTFSFDVPHGCAGQATTSVALRVPPDFAAVEPRPKAGWDLDVATDAGGATIATWSGGSFPDGQVESFRVRMTTPTTPNAVVYIPTVQECTDGRYRWIQIPTGDAAYEDLETPAPRILLGALAPAEDETTTITTAETTTAQPVSEPDPEPLAATGVDATVESVQETATAEPSGNVEEASAPSPLIIAIVLVVATLSVIAGFLLARRRRS